MDPIKVKIEIEVPVERINNCIIGASEGEYSPWLGTLKYNKGKYGEEEFINAEMEIEATYDDPDNDEEGDMTGKKTLHLEDFIKGLSLMAEKSPRHFGDLVSENDDAITHDVYMQYVILGEVVYG